MSRFLMCVCLLTGMVCCAVAGRVFARSRIAPETLSSIDLPSFMGYWYEIADSPGWFQKKRIDVTATYALEADGTVTIVNACRDKRPPYDLHSARLLARIVDGTNNTRFIPAYAIEREHGDAGGRADFGGKL